MGEFATFSGVFSALGISVGFIVGKRKSSRNLRKQNVISYNATNTMIRNRKACRTAAIPVSFVLPEVKTMKKKNNTLSIRLTNNEEKPAETAILFCFASVNYRLIYSYFCV